MYKRKDYMMFESVVSKAYELEVINRQIDEAKLKRLPSLKNELVTEFISTNNIEGDIVNLSTAKKFLREELSDDQLVKRWIGIKYAHDIIWSDRYTFDSEYISEAHRALLRNVSTPGGIWKTKINQVGSLITAHPDDVPVLISKLFLDYISTKMTEGPSVFNIIPMISEFLAIHPFEDGNGRMSRLIMNRELYEAGYKFVKYVSISKFLWESRDEYIASLEERNSAWAAKTLNPTHLVKLFNVILDALIDAAKFALKNQNLKIYKEESFKKDVIKITKVRGMSISEIMSIMNIGNSQSSIRKWLKDLVALGALDLIGLLKSSKYKAK